MYRSVADGSLELRWEGGWSAHRGGGERGAAGGMARGGGGGVHGDCLPEGAEAEGCVCVCRGRDVRGGERAAVRLGWGWRFGVSTRRGCRGGESTTLDVTPQVSVVGGEARPEGSGLAVWGASLQAGEVQQVECLPAPAAAAAAWAAAAPGKRRGSGTGGGGKSLVLPATVALQAYTAEDRVCRRSGGTF